MLAFCLNCKKLSEFSHVHLIQDTVHTYIQDTVHAPYTFVLLKMHLTLLLTQQRTDAMQKLCYADIFLIFVTANENVAALASPVLTLTSAFCRMSDLAPVETLTMPKPAMAARIPASIRWLSVPGTAGESPHFPHSIMEMTEKV